MCHWALTLMNPITPVLNEIRRVLSSGGKFAALVNGPMDAAPGYNDVYNLIYEYVQAKFPRYDEVDLGDPRIRKYRYFFKKSFKMLILKRFLIKKRMTGSLVRNDLQKISFYEHTYLRLGQETREKLVSGTVHDNVLAKQGPVELF